MKKLLFLGLLSLVSLFSLGQNLIPKDASNAYLVFRRGDGIDTYYKINSVKVFIDEATIGRQIDANSGLELVGFARTQRLSGNIFDFVPAPDTQPEQKPVTKPDNVVSGNRAQLSIPGYEDISAIYLADESLKQKDANRLNIQLATHSISLGQNLGERRSKVNYKIYDQTGKIWVEVIQKETSIEGYLGGRFGNNHPDKAYLNLSEDCNVYLPLEGTYTIEVQNLGDLAVDFWVHHPWSSNFEERQLHKEDVPRAHRAWYNISTNALGLSGMPDYMRTIKININGK